jgi:aspartate/methionine/tyrosine aminotransferase
MGRFDAFWYQSNIREKAQEMTGIVRLELGEPDFETPAHIREADKAHLRNKSSHVLYSKAGLA